MALAERVSQFAEAGRSAARSSSNGAARTPPAYGVGLVDQAAAQQQLAKRFGSFLAARVIQGKMTEVEAARALRQYKSSEAGKRDLFFHDNAVRALAAKQKLESSNIAVDGYQALAAAPELVASGRYKLLANYRKNRVEQLEEQLAEATAKARESGMEVIRRAYREKGPAAALDAAKEIASFSDDPVAAVNVVMREEKQRQEAEKRADLIRQAKYRCKKEMVATDEMCDDFFDNLGQQASVGPEGELEFSDAHVSGTAAKDWQLTPQERKNRESLLTPEDKADREATLQARRELFRIDALEGAGKAIKTGFHDLFIGMPGDLLTYGSNSLLGTNHAYRSAFGKELSAELGKGEGTDVDRIRAELAKGDKADMSVIQREIDKGHFGAGERDVIAYELRRGDRDFRKIRGVLEQGKGTDYWKVADLVGKTTVDVGSTILVLVPGAQGLGTMGKIARVANVVGDIMFVYDTLSSARQGVNAALAGDGRGFGESFGGMLQMPTMKYGGAALGRGLGAGAGWLRDRGRAFDVADPVAMHASRSGDGPGSAWSQMSPMRRFFTWLGGRRAIDRAKALDFDVDAAMVRSFGDDMFGEHHIGKISKSEQATLDAGQSIPDPYIHSVRRGNAFELASETNLPIFRQLLTHILFENEHARVEVGSGGHGGVRGNSMIDDPSMRDPSFVAGNERVAQQAGAMANVWDLSDPYSLRSWLASRSAASGKTSGASALYSIADLCWSAFSNDHKKGGMSPMTDWDARADAWNLRQRDYAWEHGLTLPVAGTKAGGGLYRGSDVRAARLAELAQMDRMFAVLDNPRLLFDNASRSLDRLAHADAQRRAAIESQRVAALQGRVGKPLDPTGRYLEPMGTRPGSLHEKVQMDRAWMQKEFGSGINHSSYEIVPRWSGRRYNCFAFTLGELSSPVQPKSARVLDPSKPFESVSEMYAGKGFVLTQQAPRLNLAYQGRPKIAVYGKVEGGKIVEITHAAIQEADGMWTSKMGPDGPLVRHATPGAIAGKYLGEPVAIFEQKP